MSNATFNGINLVNGSLTNITALANADGSGKITVNAQDMSLGGSVVTLSAAAGFSTATSAAALLTTIDTSISNVS